ncbi:DUF6225 family protein [Nonomuraea sp. NPDC050153]|uniref:DUF6225 family protein n=1 Tax=Nonomuraea sp. NPDC050153 TaxID=3364359 RepID=UPI0037B29D30
MSDIEVPHTTTVPWETVTDAKGRRAWTAGQLRAAIAHLPDDAPIVVHAAGYEEGEYDDQIIVDAGHSKVGWGDGYGLEDDPLFALEWRGARRGPPPWREPRAQPRCTTRSWPGRRSRTRSPARRGRGHAPGSGTPICGWCTAPVHVVPRPGGRSRGMAGSRHPAS